MTTTIDSTALATRDVTDERIRERIQVNRKPGFDLATATPDQLHLLYVFCKESALLPVLHVTLYQGKPWVTLDGRIELAKRHPEYRGFKTRPLTVAEKEAWQYQPTDIVVECTMRTAAWGEITARGRVTRAEIDAALGAAERSNKRPAPIALYPQEIAEKRSIGRAERLAFGQSVPDFEDEVEQRIVIEQQPDPARRAANAAAYDRVFGSDEAGTAYADIPERPIVVDAPASSPMQGAAQPPETEGPSPTPSVSASAVPVDKADMVTRQSDPLNKELRVLLDALVEAGVDTEAFSVAIPAPRSVFEVKIKAAQDAIAREDERNAAPDDRQGAFA